MIRVSIRCDNCQRRETRLISRRTPFPLDKVQVGCSVCRRFTSVGVPTKIGEGFFNGRFGFVASLVWEE